MKTKIFTLFVCLLLAVGGFAQDRKPLRNDFTVEKFDFDWVVVESGESKLVINKTPDVTRLVIAGEGVFGSLRVLPDDAAAIGTALGDVDTVYATMRADGSDNNKDVDAGQYKVTFRFSKEHGFSVAITKKEGFMETPIFLDRGAAKAFAPHLLLARDMASFIDEKLKF